MDRPSNAPSPLSFTLLALCAGSLMLGACSDDATAGSDGTTDAAIAADGVAPADGATVDVPPGDAAGPDAAPVETCPPGLTGCVGNAQLVCAADGSGWDQIPCPDDQICAAGECLVCATDADCAAGEQCTADGCVVPPLMILTEALPPGVEGVPYGIELQAKGGALPYVWELIQGDLPAGLSLSLDGGLSGVPTETGTSPLKIKVTDAGGQSETVALTLEVLGSGLHITTPSPLPLAEEGEPYEAVIEAVGGTEPHFWGVAGGSLPVGLSLSSAGVISGVPVGDGNFDVTIKVFDNGTPTLTASRDYQLPVTIAPLEIIADQVVDLFITKLIVLPVIIVVDGVPIPYNAQLEAKGGRKPYHWAEEPLPGFVASLIPNSGLPAGLTVNGDGSITGAVTDTSLAVSVPIPLTGIELSGFFFGAVVTDDQPVPYDASALYIIPTVPLGGP